MLLKKGCQKIAWKNALFLVQKWVQKGSKKHIKILVFFFFFFWKTCFWAQTSCKKWYSGQMLAPASQLMKNLEFRALACTPGPKCDFRLSEKIYFFHAAIIENCALACTRSPFLLFCAFRKKWKKKSLFFSKIAFYDVNMHIFFFLASKMVKMSRSWSTISARTQNGSQNKETRGVAHFHHSGRPCPPECAYLHRKMQFSKNRCIFFSYFSRGEFSQK